MSYNNSSRHGYRSNATMSSISRGNLVRAEVDEIAASLKGDTLKIREFCYCIFNSATSKLMVTTTFIDILLRCIVRTGKD